MTNVTTGPWDSPTPREREHEARHVDLVEFAIGRVEADPEDTRALKDVCFFACRSRFRAVRAKALEAIRAAGDRQAE